MIVQKGPPIKLKNDFVFHDLIENLICDQKYSPAAALAIATVNKCKTSISVTTLYKYITNEVFSRLTNKDLPVKHKTKKRKYRKISKTFTRGTSIEERPKSIENREEFGHWEMDTVIGKRNGKKSCIIGPYRTKNSLRIDRKD